MGYQICSSFDFRLAHEGWKEILTMKSIYNTSDRMADIIILEILASFLSEVKIRINGFRKHENQPSWIFHSKTYYFKERVLFVCVPYFPISTSKSWNKLKSAIPPNAWGKGIIDNILLKPLCANWSPRDGRIRYLKWDSATEDHVHMLERSTF